MKAASTTALAILATGEYILADLYTITLTTGASYYFTGFDVPLTAAIYPSGTTHTYLSGWTFERGETTQACGVDAQEMQITIAPKPDNPGGAPTIAGYPLMQALRLGIMDNATVLYSKLFMNYPTPPAMLDTSPAGIAFFQGAVADIDTVTRFSAQIKISSNLLVLSQVQMPKNLYQAGCCHTTYDAGCTLSKSTFTVSGKVGSTVTNNSNFYTTTSGGGAWSNTSYPNTYFALGVLTFTSGANNGFSSTIKSWANTNGVIQTMIPFPATVATGDTFTMYPGDDHTQATCTNKFSNLTHFKGMPYVPVAETLYDGGTSNPPNATAPAQQAGKTIGSAVGGNIIGITG